MARRWVTENREVIQRYNTIDDDNSEMIRGYDNVNEMIAENINDLDAIYIATPPGVHLENVRQIISALDDATTTTGVDHADDRKQQQSSRLKAIYVEKPCGRCAWETRIMIDELHHRNIQFFPAYVSRSHERTQVLHKLLSNKSSIGDQVRKVQYVQRGSSFARGLDGDGGEGIPWRLAAEY